MDRELFIKYIQNRCSEAEFNHIIDWFDKDAGSLSGYTFFFRLWSEIRKEDSELSKRELSLLDRIHHDINKQASERLLESTRNKPAIFRKRKQLITSFYRIAAILVLPLLLFSIFLAGDKVFNKRQNDREKPTTTKVHSPVGSISQIELPDGTKVWLNHNTTLIYPNGFSKSSRLVTLSGEAYFQVKHDPDVPFVVSIENIHILATGTEFNVKAFPEMKSIETMLLNGKVTLQKKTSQDKYVTFFEMKSHQLAIYHRATNQLEYSRTNPDKHMLWIEGKLLFENDPLDKVAERLSRFYNVEIIINDPILSEFTYTATFEDETLRQVMELLKLATPIDYSITSRKKLENGTWTKRKVYISYKMD